jgi:hypothetical protein
MTPVLLQSYCRTNVLNSGVVSSKKTGILIATFVLGMSFRLEKKRWFRR